MWLRKQKTKTDFWLWSSRSSHTLINYRININNCFVTPLPQHSQPPTGPGDSGLWTGVFSFGPSPLVLRPILGMSPNHTQCAQHGTWRVTSV